MGMLEFHFLLPGTGADRIRNRAGLWSAVVFTLHFSWAGLEHYWSQHTLRYKAEIVTVNVFKPVYGEHACSTIQSR